MLEWEAVREKFKQVWGYDDFRSPQAEVISNLLQHRDSIVILATGSGKSICFQLPALLQSGLTIVISPLLALMEDQVQDLQRRNLPAATLHSSLSMSKRREVLQKISHLRLLYISPETLLSTPVWQRLCDRNLSIAGLMLDEAHCLVQWGDSFRPAYRRLGAVRKELRSHKSDDHGRIAIAAFTATANLYAQTELQSCLQLQNPQVIRTSPYRSNLSLNVAIAWTPAGRKSQALKFIRSFQGKSGLIYVRSRRETEALAEWLQQESFTTSAYHAGLPPESRREIEQRWLSGDYAFVVCSSAFGLGINKPDVRWILHFHAPLTLSEYIQEVGRAGRDGMPARALMLVSEPTGWLDQSDRQRQDFFVQQQQKLLQRAKKLLPKLPRQGNYAEVAKLDPDVAIALGLLHSAGKLTWRNPFEYEIKAGNYQLPDVDTTTIEQMQDYLSTRNCRWSFLMQAFGFEPESKNLKCGICDRCKPR
jgi:ATP-dependent DNA helicase RecQ